MHDYVLMGMDLKTNEDTPALAADPHGWWVIFCQLTPWTVA